MDIGDRVMVKSGCHGGMIGTLTSVREKRVRQGRQPNWIEKPVGTITFSNTGRAIDEVLSNITPVPVHPFA